MYFIFEAFSQSFAFTGAWLYMNMYMPAYKCTHLQVRDVYVHMPFFINEAVTTDCCFTFASVYTLLYLECFADPTVVNSVSDSYFVCFPPHTPHPFTFPTDGLHSCFRSWPQGMQLCWLNAVVPISHGMASVPLFRDCETGIHPGFVLSYVAHNVCEAHAWRAVQTQTRFKHIAANQ